MYLAVEGGKIEKFCLKEENSLKVPLSQVVEINLIQNNLKKFKNKLKEAF